MAENENQAEGNKKAKKALTLSFLGDQNVGKTSICNVYLKLGFSETALSTIGEDISKTLLKLKNKETIILRLCDTAGQERFRSVSLDTIRRAKGVIVVFDVSVRETFEKLNYWIDQIRDHSKSLPIVLFGNKCDKDDRQVTTEEAKEFAKKNNLLYYETSAKNNSGITEGINQIAEMAYSMCGFDEKNLKLKKKDDDDKKKKGCC